MQMPAPAEVFLSVEVNGLRAAGAEVHVFSLRQPHPKHRQLVVDQKLEDVPLYHFPYVRDKAVWQAVRYWEGVQPGIWRQLNSLIIRTCWRRPTLLVKSLAIVPKSFRIAQIVRQENIQAVHSAWGHHPAITGYLIKKLMPHVGFSLALGAYDWLMRHPMTLEASKVADVMLTQSKASAISLREVWPKPAIPVQTIHRGIDLSTLLVETEKSPRPLVVSVGRLSEVKGHQHLIEAFTQVKQHLPTAQLIIWGEGDYRAVLERQIANLGLQDAVQLPGHIPQPALFPQLAQASLFVLASVSKGDNLPNSVKEAMALGLPVITTPTISIDELIEEGQTGFVVPMRAVDALAEKMIYALSNQKRLATMQKQAEAHVRQRFDIRDTTQARMRLYQELT